MIENQLRERLDAAIADEPPLGFDPLTAADDARHATRARRGLLTGIATTAVAVAAVAVVTVTVADLGGGPSGAGGSTGPSVAATGGPSNGPYVPGPVEGPEQFRPTRPGSDPHGLGPRAERIAERLVSRLPQVAPGVTAMRPVDFGQQGGAGDYSERDDHVEGMIAFDDADGATALVVKVSTPAAPDRGPCVTRDPGVTCRVVPRPDGSTLLVYDGPALRSVLHQRLDGSAAEVTVYLSKPLDPSAPRRDTFPLDEAQLTALATDLELRL